VKRPDGEVGAVRRAVFAAAAAGDSTVLQQLCMRYADAIAADFGEWARVPAELRADPAATQRYVETLIGVARLLERLGHPGPMQRLTGTPDNPITRSQRALAYARECDEAGDRDEAAATVEAVLGEMSGMSGPAVIELRSKAYGLLGAVRLHQGDLRAARAHTTHALDDSRAAGDADGIRIYTENLALIDAIEDRGPAADRRARIARAQDLSDAMRYHLSNEVLHALLPEMNDADPLRAKACGLLGLNLYHLGDHAGARSFTAEAVAACRRAGDDFGVAVYIGNLQAIDRVSPTAAGRSSPAGRPAAGSADS
jgi:hypothetical protein